MENLKTIEDFKAYAKEQKQKARKFEKQNAELVAKLLSRDSTTSREKKTLFIEQAIIMQRAITKIQALWRGGLERFRYRKMLKYLQLSSNRASMQINTNEAAFVEMYKAVKKIGLTLEMVFRAADVQGTGTISVEDLRIFLKRLRMKRVSPALISKFVFAIDEANSGLIAKEDYMRCLIAYKVAQETEKNSNSRVFEQHCITRLGRAIKERNLIPEKAYQTLDPDSKGFIPVDVLVKFLNAEHFEEKEAACLVAVLDIDGTRRILKEDFLYYAAKGVTDAWTHPKGTYQPQAHHVRFRSNASLTSTVPAPVKNLINTPLKQSILKHIPLTESNVMTSPEVKKAKVEPPKSPEVTINKKDPEPAKHIDATQKRAEYRNLLKIIVKMELETKPLREFLFKFMLGIKNPADGITAADFLLTLDQEYGTILKKEERKMLCDEFDTNKDGKISIFEVKDFFVNMARISKEKIVTLNLLAVSTARLLEVDKKSTDDYLISLDIEPKKKYPYGEFHEKFKASFDLTEEEATSIFKELDPKSGGFIDTAKLVQTINSFRRDVQQPKGAKSLNLDKSFNEGVTITAGDKSSYMDQTRIQDENAAEKQILKKAIVKLELNEKPLRELIEEILIMMVNPIDGIHFSDLKSFLQKEIGSILKPEELSALANSFDVNKDRHVNANEIRGFFVRMIKNTKESLIDNDGFELLLARLAQVSLVTTDRYLQNLGFSVKGDTKTTEFIEKFKEFLKLPDDVAEELLRKYDPENFGKVDLNNLMEKVNKLRNDIVNGSIDKTKSNVTIIPAKFKKAIKSEEIEIAAKKMQKKQLDLIAGLRTAFREENTEPLSIWNTAIGDEDTKASVSLLARCLASGIQMNETDVITCSKIFQEKEDADVDKRIFDMLVMDETSMADNYKVTKNPRPAEDFDTAVVLKFKKVLKSMGTEPDDFYDDLDLNRSDDVSLMEFKNGLVSELPASQFSLIDIAKMMISIDKKNTGTFRKAEFMNILGGTTSTKNAPKIEAPLSSGIDASVNKLKDYAIMNLDMKNEIKDIFFKSDDNNDGRLDKREFFNALEKLGIGLDDQDKQNIYTVADLDKNGDILLEEFFKFMRAYEMVIDEPIGTESLNTETKPKPKAEPPKPKLTSKATIKEIKKQSTSVETESAVDAAQEAAEKDFSDFILKYTVSPDDYFIKERTDVIDGESYTRKGMTTILNDQIRCLRRCYDIVQEIKKSGLKSWVDPDFGPDPNNEEDHGDRFLYHGDPPLGYPEPQTIKWCRLKEIAVEKPHFLDNSASSNDVIQGEIGDCWLIGGFSVIATNDVLINGFFNPTSENVKDIDDTEAEGMSSGLYPPMFHFLRKYGIYVVRFFKDYGWRYVIIDDRFPCYKNDSGQADLVFGKCRNHSEFWVPILEKAYAKLHNCYESLIAGYLDDGLSDMTGWATYKIKLQGPKGFPSPQVKSADELWKTMLEYKANNSMMGCSVQGNPGETEHEVMIDDEPAGILKSHAYAIIDLIELPNPTAQNSHKSHRLLRIRNPWGRKEWSGKWSDGSPKLLEHIQKLNDNIKKRAGDGEFEEFNPEDDDGTFLMSFKDWRTIYNNLYCCIKFPNEWSGVRFLDNWTAQNSGGTPVKANDKAAMQLWATNPQYCLELDVPERSFKPGRSTTKLFIGLGQPDGRLNPGEKFPFKDHIQGACFTVAELPAGQKTLTEFDKTKVKFLSPLKEYRDNSLSVELPNGRYVIVPSCAKPKSEGRYFLNIYYECDKKHIKVYNARTETKGESIKEEEETELHSDSKFKKVLKIL